jgi:hypothetical protein
VFLVIGLVIAAIVVLTLNRPGRDTAPRVGEPATSGAPVPGSGAVLLGGQLVADPAGPDAMRGVAVLGSGDLVAVGFSIDLHPRAWVRHGAAWRSVAVPSPSGTGGVDDVAVNGSRVVAVGWTRTGAVQHPAVWTGTAGDAWTAADLSLDLKAAGVTELSAVTASGAGFLAIGVDRAVDTADGDAAVFRSDDGVHWQRITATGLDGPGPQDVHRVVQADGRYVAVGSALVGAARGPAVWTSTDGAKWQPMLVVPPGSPTLWTVLRLADGTLLSCGAAGPVEHPVPGCWQLRDGKAWDRLDVRPDSGAPVPLYLYGLTTTPSGVVGVGTTRNDAGVDAGVWQLRLAR